MIRGTTPKLEFRLPFNVDLLAEVWVTLAQRGEVIINKELEECDCDENMLSVQLTQEETLLLECECKTEIQVRVKTLENEALASDIITVNTDRILKEGVI